MSSRLIIDGNAVYEIDEECMKIKMEREEKWTGERGGYFRRQDEARYGNEDENDTP